MQVFPYALAIDTPPPANGTTQGYLSDALISLRGSLNQVKPYNPNPES